MHIPQRLPQPGPCCSCRQSLLPGRSSLRRARRWLVTKTQGSLILADMVAAKFSDSTSGVPGMGSRGGTAAKSWAGPASCLVVHVCNFPLSEKSRSFPLLSLQGSSLPQCLQGPGSCCSRCSSRLPRVMAHCLLLLTHLPEQSGAHSQCTRR